MAHDRLAFLLAAILAFAPEARAVVGGQFDADNTYRHTGVFLVFPKGTNTLLGMCSGVLVHERVVLTAGHCAALPQGTSAADYDAFVSFSNDRPRTDPTTWIPVIGGGLHPTFPANGSFPSLGAGVSDIGYYLLGQPAKGIKPAPLAFPNELQNESGVHMTLVGYGCAPGGGAFNGVRSFGGTRLALTYNGQWARFTADPAYSCVGDSGGPILNDDRVVALTSQPTGDARVDDPAVLSWIAATIASLPPALVDAVEFYNQTLDHYFVSWIAPEIAILDAGTAIKGWHRTGEKFKVYASLVAGTSVVCRFYLPLQFGDSHFYGRGDTECSATGAKNPGFVLEDPHFMYVFLPDAGNCPPDTVPIYRAFSNRPDTNHRYMVNRALLTQMEAAGWIAEGDGPDLVAMCGPKP